MSRGKILLLSADPTDEDPLRVAEEFREIRTVLELAGQRDAFAIEERHCVRVRDLGQALLTVQPKIVHFAGHGSGTPGLCFEDEAGKARLVSGEALGGFFELLTGSVECVVLSACLSDVQAEAIAAHIPYVVGMTDSIFDDTAVKFARGFYRAIFNGIETDRAFKFGLSELSLEGSDEADVPVLYRREDDAGPHGFETRVSKPAADAEDLRFYRELVEFVASELQLAEWNNWTSHLLTVSASWDPELMDAIGRVDQRMFVADWPGTLPDLETAMTRLVVSLKSAADSFSKHCELRNERLYAYRWYKFPFPNPNYDHDLAEFESWQTAIENLIAEATRAANWTRHLWRLAGNSDFLAGERISITSGPHAGFQFITYVPEYTPEEQLALLAAGRASVRDVRVDDFFSADGG